MVILLVAITFLMFFLVDALAERRRRARHALEGRALQDRLLATDPQWVAGYNLPTPLHYHQGHAWAHWVGPDVAYVGIDDFGRRLLGAAHRATPPSVGTWVTQGEPAARLGSKDDGLELLSPLTGEIIEVNEALKKDPQLLQNDSYGQGWLYKIRSPHLFTELHNLMNGTLAQRWMQDVQLRFQHQLMLASGSVIQDGGTTVENLADHLDPAQWRDLVDEFLLQDSIRPR